MSYFHSIKTKVGKVLDDRQSAIRQRYYFPGYKPVCEKRDYAIYKPSLTGKRIVSAWNNVVCCQSNIHPNTLYLYPNYKNTHRVFRILVNNKQFPGLIPESKVLSCLIVPYIREETSNRFINSWRLVVITDKCQVYHNFPCRNPEFDGESQLNDIKVFAESEIWDLPGNKYPSNKIDHDDSEYYNPFLPEECYEYYPRITGNSLLGGRGYSKTKTIIANEREISLSRFYFPQRRMETNPFRFMGGYEPDYKMTLIGSYCSNMNVGARIIVFATSNGGRDIFAKYEFEDSCSRENYGNPLNGKCLSEIDCKNNELYLQITSSSPDKKFDDRSIVRVSKVFPTNPIRIELEKECSIKSGNVVSLLCDQKSKEVELLFHIDSDCVAPRCKVKKIGDRQFELFELASKSRCGISCRHVHGINRVKDGWLICTGEKYPEGWLFYAQLHAADTWERADAANELLFMQLNSSAQSIQRLIGCILYDDKENTLIVASDSSSVLRNNFYQNLSHSSTGIYKGRITDVDDFRKFELICEMIEPCYLFKEINGVLVATGQRGEFAISFDKGKSWEKNRIDKQLQNYCGKTSEFAVIDGWLVVFR